MEQLEPVHFQWTPEAVRKGKAPRCVPEFQIKLVTQDPKLVTCERCTQRIVEIITEWVEAYGPGKPAGPRS